MIKEPGYNTTKQTAYAGLLMFVAATVGQRNAHSMKCLVNENVVDLEKRGNSTLTAI